MRPILFLLCCLMLAVLLMGAFQENSAGTYAEIYVHDGAAAQSITNGTAYEKLTLFVSNGMSSNATADVANDKITITYPGTYHVTHTGAAISGTAAAIFDLSMFLGGAEQQQCETTRKYGTAGDIGAHAISCFVNVTSVPIDLDMRARHDRPAPVNYTMQDGSLIVEFTGRAL